MKKLNILFTCLLAVSHCTYYADITENSKIRIEFYKGHRYSFNQYNIQQITIKIKNGSESPIKLLEDSFAGIPILSNEQFKNIIMNTDSFFKRDMIIANQNDGGIILFSSLLVGPAVFGIGGLMAGMCISRDKDTVGGIAAISAMVGYFIPLFFYKKLSFNTDKVNKKIQDTKNKWLQRINNPNLTFNPPIIIKPGELRTIELYIDAPISELLTLWIEIYDSLGKQVISRFSKEFYVDITTYQDFFEADYWQYSRYI